MRRTIIAFVISSLVITLVPGMASATPVATSDVEYTGLGRVFPDPHGCHQSEPGYSPYAKGNVCASDFLQFSELESGLRFLQRTFPRFVKVYVLHKDFNCKGRPVADPDAGCANFKSAGLPQTIANEGQDPTPFQRERSPLYMLRITDEKSPIPLKRRKHFVFPLSIHGIERAGAEGGTRAAEDLATWGACEAKTAPDYVECAIPENEAPHPLLEATPKRSIKAGAALRRSAVFFIYPNPDGWRRGERTEGAQFFQRYNGNGVDLNRDWPQEGFTYRPYTPWSEPESRGFGRSLQGVGPEGADGRAKWAGGIDLHGQLVDRAFSFTLIGNAQRPYDKNQRVLQVVKGAWRDAEKRLAWSPLIKPNDAPPQDPRMYGVQWGTVWDTINYTVTGALGDWIDSPIGLDADGIDNEMSLSHLSNCGVGTCWDPDVEQLHVDGNKSLVYAMINYTLKPERTSFVTRGRVAYLHHPQVISEKTDRLAIPPRFAKLPPQPDIVPAGPEDYLSSQNNHTKAFTVKGPAQGFYNGGLAATITCSNAQGISPCAFQEAQLQRRSSEAHRDDAEGEWETVNTYYNQSAIYIQAGQALHANLPTPGRWRVRIDGASTTDLYRLEIDFTKEKGWPDPGQIGYRATNMQFWRDLKKFVRPGLVKTTRRQLAGTNRWQRRYDTIVITDKVYRGLNRRLLRWVRGGGNLVLTDKALKMLKVLGIVKGGVVRDNRYAGYVNFATQKRENTYKDPLARRINQPGAAEGGSPGPGDPPPSSDDEVHRHQTYEPVPLNFAIQTPNDNDAYNSPNWSVSALAFKEAKGKQRAIGTTGDKGKISMGEIKLGKGRIRFIGAVLPMPTDQFDNPYGVSDYSLTYSGYQILKNLLRWRDPTFGFN